MHPFLSALLSSALAILLVAATTALAAPGIPNPDRPAGPILGVVPVRGAASRTGGSGGNLMYHNGPVMHTNSTYAIYWMPTGYAPSGGAVSPAYQSVINGFLSNVAADDGKASNVYASTTQYSDYSGAIAYGSSFTGAKFDQE